jgi:hypothetical protein
MGGGGDRSPKSSLTLTTEEVARMIQQKLMLKNRLFKVDKKSLL